MVLWKIELDQWCLKWKEKGNFCEDVMDHIYADATFLLSVGSLLKKKWELFFTYLWKWKNGTWKYSKNGGRKINENDRVGEFN
jgi:hypothetical protein